MASSVSSRLYLCTWAAHARCPPPSDRPSVTNIQLPVAASTGDIILDRRFEWARESLGAGDAAGAADVLGQLLASMPEFAPAWFLLGDARERLGDRAAAVAAFTRARATDPQDGQGAALRLARLGATPPAPMPVGYIRALFDGYAPQFEQILIERLDYRGPELMLRAIERASPGGPMRFARALDLGSGTGLVGVAFRPFCDALTGVDLSPRMLAAARAKAIYDRLVEGEAMTLVAAEAARAARYDLILSADVFIYFHELMQLRAVAPIMVPGGLFVFTVETHDGDGVILRDTLRYAHGAAHVRAALAAAGLDLVSLDSDAARAEKGVPVPGLVVVARAPSS